MFNSPQAGPPAPVAAAPAPVPMAKKSNALLYLILGGLLLMAVLLVIAAYLFVKYKK
jgi:hypothetical protein